MTIFYHTSNKFQPTPSARRVTRTSSATKARTPSFQPTPSARRVTRALAAKRLGMEISTHTLRKEGDRDESVPGLIAAISTHTLRKEGDSDALSSHSSAGKFQPTPSARRVTIGLARAHRSRLISTHTLRKEGDAVHRSRVFSSSSYFNPHPPQGG